MRILLIVALCLLMHAARKFAPMEVVGSGAAAITLSVGFLLLTSIIAGSLLQRIGLPRLTAYFATGILVGPGVLDLISLDMLDGLTLFRGLAVSFIALLAGSELSIQSLRPHVRGTVVLTVVCLVVTIAALTGATFAVRDLIPALEGLELVPALALCAVIGTVLAVSSPLVAMALRDETESSGPLTRTVLAVTTIGSLGLVAIFAVVSGVARGANGETTDALAIAGRLSWTLLGSLAFGVAIGVAFTAYLRRLKTSAALFAAAASLVAAELAPRLNLDPLVLSLAAGIFLRNATDLAPRVQADLKPVSLPIYVAFFAIAGAAVPMGSFATAGVAALALFGARVIALQLGWRVGSLGSGLPAEVKRLGGVGLLPQADTALMLAILSSSLFPAAGVFEIIVAVVAMNELVGPILFRACLARTGEIGRALAGPDEDRQVELPLDAEPVEP